MSLKPGAAVLPSDRAESRPAADAVEAGDCITFQNGEMVQADETDEFAGIAGQSDRNILSGVVVANVHTDDPDGAVVEGALLSPSPTAGELYRDYSLDVDENPVYDQPGPVLALTDEGGTWHGKNGTYDVPDGYAVVHIRGR